MTMTRWLSLSLLALPLSTSAAQLPAGLTTRIDSIVRAEMAAGGVPSVSLAVVKDGAIAYARAYGNARISPSVPATPAMRYSIGSVSKQFTAAAVLMLAEERKLSLDDKVSRYLPDLTRASEITIRQLLSMTSGYQDYWPQDYVMDPMTRPITPRGIMDTWAKKPLDFEPGTKWQYSNTNYVIAGAIIEKVTGKPVVDFLRQRIFAPLRMESVQIIDEHALGPGDPERYERFGLGPLRVAPKEGTGWLFAMGELAMTLSDLARWDMSVIGQALMKPESYRAQQRTILLADGRSSGYGLGVSVGSFQGHRMISHGGEVSGFTTRNAIFPDDRAAVAVSANLFVTDAPANIANRVAELILPSTDVGAEQALQLARRVFTDLQQGRIDRARFTSNANLYFTDVALGDIKASIGSCRRLTDFRQTGTSLRGGMVYRGFSASCGEKEYSVATFFTSDGKIEQYVITP